MNNNEEKKQGRDNGGTMQINMKTVGRLMGYLGHYKVRIILVIVCIILSSIASVVPSLFLQRLIDDYITPLLLDANPVYTGLIKALVGVGCIYAVGVISNLVYNRTMARVSHSILKEIRDEMFDHMQKLPVSYFDGHTNGDIMSRYTNDTDSLRQMITQSVPQFINAIVSIVVVFVSMVYLSVWLTLFIIAFSVVLIRLAGFIAGHSGTYFVKQQRSLGDMDGYIEEMINGQKVVKVFCHEEEAKAVFDEKNKELNYDMATANTYANILMPVMNNAGHAIYAIMAVVGGGLAIAGVTNLSITGFGVMTLGIIASFLTLIRSFINPVSQVSQQLNSIVMALAGATRIFELMDEPVEKDDGYVTLVNAKVDENGDLTETDERTGVWAWKHPHREDGTVTYERVTGNVVLQDVDFAYEEGKEVLHDINIYAEPGQKVALVGATGAGKTTITNLINRFYDIEEGKVRYDGININKIKKPDLRRSLGIVLQDVNLFTGTVMENIRYGRLDATDEECINAAKLANADGFIRMLPQGYDTVLEGDGSGLSQGQRQLISIARAAVADPPVMVLDEATSSIDTRTEALVQKGMDALMKGRTVFVIAHRLSTVQNADVIMVMDHGRIIERGNHEKLIAEKGMYYKLYTGAFELE